MAFATIGDEIVVAPADKLSLRVDGPFARDLGGNPNDNLVWRAAMQLGERLVRAPNVAIRLTKNLPVASGIGGGSSDAAACLTALAALWQCDDRAILMEVGAQLGSDVPACLAARPVWFGGIGEEIDEAGAIPECGVVLVNPGIALPTASVYRAFKGPFSPTSRFPIPDDPEDFADMLATRRNDLTDAAIAQVPEIAAVLDTLAKIDSSLLARMSGSGATCFALFATMAEAETAARALRRAHPAWWIASAELSSGPAPNA